MRKTYLVTATVVALTASMMFSSCIGSFALYNKVRAWNDQVGNKFVNELVFVALWILPVYELSFTADILVLNSIEFWSGNNPVVAETKVIDGKDARYLVEKDATGYAITNLSDKSVTRFNFHAEDNSWWLENNGKDVKFMTFVDDSHVRMLTRDGGFTTVPLNEQGVLAYEQLVTAEAQMAMR